MRKRNVELETNPSYITVKCKNVHLCGEYEEVTIF